MYSCMQVAPNLFVRVCMGMTVGAHEGGRHPAVGSGQAAFGTHQGLGGAGIPVGN
jgi:hypothetical protein